MGGKCVRASTRSNSFEDRNRRPKTRSICCFVVVGIAHTTCCVCATRKCQDQVFLTWKRSGHRIAAATLRLDHPPPPATSLTTTVSSILASSFCTSSCLFKFAVLLYVVACAHNLHDVILCFTICSLACFVFSS